MLLELRSDKFKQFMLEWLNVDTDDVQARIEWQQARRILLSNGIFAALNSLEQSNPEYVDRLLVDWDQQHSDEQRPT